MAKPEMGTKRQCGSCGAKFFDLNRDPILCPKCGTTFQATAPTRMAARAVVPDDDEKEPDAAADLVPLEDADAPDALADVADVEDVEADDTPDDTFLEEEEGGDDVSGLIDGDLETDEEP